MIARCLLLALFSAVSGLVITPPLRLAPATTATPRCGLSLQQPPRMAVSPAPPSSLAATCRRVAASPLRVATALLRVVGASIFSSARAVENIADRIDPSTSTLRFVDRTAMAAMPPPPTPQEVARQQLLERAAKATGRVDRKNARGAPLPKTMWKPTSTEGLDGVTQRAREQQKPITYTITPPPPPPPPGTRNLAADPIYKVPTPPSPPKPVSFPVFDAEKTSTATTTTAPAAAPAVAKTAPTAPTMTAKPAAAKTAVPTKPAPTVVEAKLSANQLPKLPEKKAKSSAGSNPLFFGRKRAARANMPATRAKAAKPGKIIKKPPTTEVTVIDEGDVALPATVGSASKVSNEDRKKWQWKGASIPTAKRATK